MPESTTKIGMPSVSGFGNSLKAYGYGAGAGLVYAILSGMVGGFWGSLIGAGLSGAIFKGDTGRTVSTMLGFMALGSLAGQGSAAASSTATPRQVM